MTPLMQQLETMVQSQIEVDTWRTFAYELAGALAEEVHYSQTPTSRTLELLTKARTLFDGTDLISHFDELKINELEPVE